MVVRIRLPRGPLLRANRPKNRQFCLGLAALLQPAAVMACVLAFWRIGADLDLMKDFAISSGPLSYWQVWLGIAVLFIATSSLLNRYAQAGQDDYVTEFTD